MSDLRHLLDDTQLATLRAGFSDDLMGRAGVAALADGYPPAAPWVQAAGDRHYLGAGPRRAYDRETAVLAVLTAQGRSQELAIHIYWALMTGHDVEQVLDVLFLASTYGGFPAWHSALRVMRRVLPVLADQAATPEGADCRRVVAAIVSAVP